MARIPEDEIDRLKAEVSLQRLAEKRGIALRRHGADLVGLCPFHDDHEPSLVISPAKNLWHCLGACGAGGSVIDWVMRTEGISFRHAVELLRADLPAGTGTGSAPGRSVTRKLAPPIEADAADAEVLAQVVAYYHETLKQSPEAQAYLACRKLDSAELVARFRLGFANRTLGYRLPHSSSVEGGALRSHLTRLRQVVGADPNSGALRIGDIVEVGSTAQFQVRDASSADQDLRRMVGDRTAEAALVFTCNGRGTHLFPEAHHDAIGGDPGLRTRALQRLPGRPRARRGRRRGRALRPQGHGQAAQGHAGPPLPARASSRRVQRRGPGHRRGDHPL